MTEDEAALGVLWGKTSEDGAWHPLVYHMIDVAQVALALWQEVLPPAAQRRVAAALGVAPEDAGRWTAFWAALHDVGKASPAFAVRKSKARAPSVVAALGSPPDIQYRSHGVITACAVLALRDDLGLPIEVARMIATALGGHHGVLPEDAQVAEVPKAARGGARWESARLTLAAALARSLKVPLDKPPLRLDNATAMFIAGLVSVADWIGSSVDHFPPANLSADAEPAVDLVSYLPLSRARAAEALARLGWAYWRAPTQRLGFGELFPKLAGSPRPLQGAVTALAQRLDRPTLVLIEAPMGEGKTEAAMYLADVAGASLGQQGCYFALPTQATSDQMFGRVREFLAARYPEEVVNLQLLHGHAALSAEFAELRHHGDRLFMPAGIHDERESGTGQVAAAEWFTYRKRGLLAPFGVGTVDQALLAALQTRHVFVRLFGLAHKPVVLDEVHAYETYTTALIERLLEWLAALGSSVVLLSATLPQKRARALLAAYARGLGGVAPPPLSALASYPRLTWLNEAGSDSEHVPASPEIARTLAIEHVSGRAAVADPEPYNLGLRLRRALENGGCAAVICNTVRRAQEVYRALKGIFPEQADDGWPELDLLHARFLYEERQRREHRALLRFGKPDARVKLMDGESRLVRRPRRAVLVASQIIEQSLDIDFDLMVSDLAPVDLLLQRSGRLWRHQRERPKGIEGPRLLVCGPETGADGVPIFDPGEQKVYDPHVLLRSWLALRGCCSVDVPGEVEALIEAVYDDRACPDGLDGPLRTRWEETWRQHRLEIAGEEREAAARWLKHPSYDGAFWRLAGEPREEDTPEFHRAHQALTRLAEPSADVICLYGSADRPSFDPAGTERVDATVLPSVPVAKRLLQRSVVVTDRRVVFTLLEQPVPAGWQRSPLLRRHRLVAFDGAGRAAVGAFRLCLHAEVGLMVEKS